MRRRIAIVHHDRSFFALDLRRAIGDDLEPVWVLVGDIAADAGTHRLLSRSGPVLPATGLGIDELAERLGALRPDGIVTFVDDALTLTAALAARLGLLYHSESVAATVADKIEQRTALHRAGIPGPQFWALGPELHGDALTARAHEVVYPAVLKPAAGSGSRGLRSLACPRELLRAHVPGTASLVEAYMADGDGDPRFASYLSLESIVVDGRATHVASCGRFPLAHPFRETGNFIPAAIGPDLRDALATITGAAIRALGIQTGITHTEIKLTDAGPRVIEINGRLGGRPPFVLRTISEINLFRVACQLALGDPVELPTLAEPPEVGFWWMGQPPQNAIALRSLHGVEAVAALPGVDGVTVNRRPGDPVDWREGTAGQIVTVRGRVPSHAALAATVDAIAKRLHVSWVPAGEPLPRPTPTPSLRTRGSIPTRGPVPAPVSAPPAPAPKISV